ncbi:MAG: NUDIX domain-containing protein [Flavobacteriales bacterium]
MYKVFINNKSIFLTENTEKGEFFSTKKEIKSLLKFIKKRKETDFQIEVKNLNQFWTLFKSCHIYIKAAGGLVYNKKSKLLVIYRNKKWDLPKGKKEKGESTKACALREVEEETGCKNLKLKKAKKQVTYHTYYCKHNKAMALKKCSWFEMKTTKKSKLKPQREEDISEVFWMPKKKLKTFRKKTYLSLRDLDLFQ